MSLPEQRQSDPNPPGVIEAANPSLLLYAVLLGLAALMIVIAFCTAPPDWPALFLNLSTEVIGAVILLIIVDRRIRQSDLRLIQGLSVRAQNRFWVLFAPDTAFVARYSAIFNAQLDVVRPHPFFRRVSLDRIEERHSAGFVLAADAGIGKTATLQDIAVRLARTAITTPRSAPVPVLLPMHRWIPNDLVDSIAETLNSYSTVSKRTVHRLIELGRIVVLADGVDESPNHKEFKAELDRFRNRFPKIQVIVSTRPYLGFSIDGLPVISIDPLTRQETEDFIKLFPSRRGTH
jgi:hypothetical protein